MTYETFKQLVKTRKKGDIKLPDESDYPLLIKESIERVCSENVIPYKLVCFDNSKEVLKPLDGESFIRVPSYPANEDDVIDIDDGLILAVMYDLLSVLSSDIQRLQFFTEEKYKTINNYNWNSFRAYEESQNE